MKAVVAAFNQERALVGAFSMIVQPVVEPMDRFTALIISLIVAATGEEAGLGVAAPAQHQPGQPAGGGVRGEEHLHGVLVTTVTVISRQEDGCNHIMKDT